MLYGWLLGIIKLNNISRPLALIAISCRTYVHVFLYYVFFIKVMIYLILLHKIKLIIKIQ